MNAVLGWHADGLGSWKVRNSSFLQGGQKGHGNNLAKALILITCYSESKIGNPNGEGRGPSCPLHHDNATYGSQCCQAKKSLHRQWAQSRAAKS